MSNYHIVHFKYYNFICQLNSNKAGKENCFKIISIKLNSQIIRSPLNLRSVLHYKIFQSFSFISFIENPLSTKL